MATGKQSDSKPLPRQDQQDQQDRDRPSQSQPRPGPLPAEEDAVRDVGKRAHGDVESPKKDTDESGYDGQRREAPEDAPTKRSGIEDGSKD